MASGNTLIVWTPLDNVTPVSAPATLDTRDGTVCLDFNDTSAESAYFIGIMPSHYSGGGLSPRIYWAATSAQGTGTVGWLIDFDRVAASGQNVAVSGFGNVTTAAAVSAPTSAGQIQITSVAIATGSAIDSVAAGDYFKFRLRRDVSSDFMIGDAELYGIELRET